MAKNNQKTVESEEENRTEELERESEIEDFIENFGDEVNNDVRENYQAYGLTLGDVQKSTDKFNQAIIDEIIRVVDEGRN